MRRRHPLSLTAAALVATGALFLAACGGDDGGDKGASSESTTVGGGADKGPTGIGPEGTGPAPEKVTLAIRLDIDKFDPHTTLSDFGAQQMMPFLYDTMLRRDLATNKVIPDVAEKWEIDPTFTKGTFTIRDGITCSDGTPLTATAVKNSFERMADPTSGAFGTSRLFGPGGVKSMTADDATRTFTLEVNAPNNELETAMVNSGWVVCPAGLADVDALKTTPQGSGPYELVDAQRDSQYTLERRDDYNHPPEGTKMTDLPKTVVIKVIKEDATTAELLSQGKLDIGSVLTQDAKRLQSEGKLVSVPAQVFGTDAITFFQGEGTPGADPEFRKGVAQLIDSKAGAAAQYQGLASPRRTLYTPNLDCYVPDDEAGAPAFDPAAAEKTLDAAGYKKGADGKRTKPDGSKLTLNVVGNNTQGQIVQYLSDALSAAGLDVKPFSGTYTESVQKLLQGEFDLGSFPFISSTPSPGLWQTQIGTDASSNFFKVNNEAFDNAAEAAVAATNETERCAQWDAGQKAVLEAANVVPIAQPTNFWFGNGVTFNTLFFKLDPFTIRSKK